MNESKVHTRLELRRRHPKRNYFRRCLQLLLLIMTVGSARLRPRINIFENIVTKHLYDISLIVSSRPGDNEAPNRFEDYSQKNFKNISRQMKPFESIFCRQSFNYVERVVWTDRRNRFFCNAKRGSYEFPLFYWKPPTEKLICCRLFVGWKNMGRLESCLTGCFRGE